MKRYSETVGAGTNPRGHRASNDGLSLTTAYGHRMAVYLRRRLGYCADKKLAGVLDLSPRQARRLLSLDDGNTGPTAQQLLALHADPMTGGRDLIAAAFPDAVQAEDQAHAEAAEACARADMATAALLETMSAHFSERGEKPTVLSRLLSIFRGS